MPPMPDTSGDDVLLSLPDESKEFTATMTAGVVLAMVGFGMYSWTKLASRSAESKPEHLTRSGAFQPLRNSDMGAQLCCLPHAERLSMRGCCVKGTTLSPAVLTVKGFAQPCITLGPASGLHKNDSKSRVHLSNYGHFQRSPDFAAGRGGDE